MAYLSEREYFFSWCGDKVIVKDRTMK